jgi:nucleoside-diphosphate-sugar epimerase
MTTLITGGLGFLGLNVVEALLARGDRVVVFDRHTDLPDAARRVFDRAPGDYRLVAGDVRDAHGVRAAMREHGVTRCVHAAAITPGPEREARDGGLVVEVNAMGTMRVLQAAAEHGVERFVYPSSASVYGANAFDDPLLEEGATHPVPNAFYGIGKYAAERAVLRAAEVWGLGSVVARVGAAFGPWERGTGVRDTLSAPMLTMRMAMQGKEAVLRRPGPRDWVYARDVAAALIALLDAPAYRHDLYHVSSGFRWSVADWCERLQRAFPGFTYRIDDDPAAVNVPFGARDRSPLSVERLRSEFMTPAFDLDAAFADYLAWTRSVDDFWMR